jgi:hypothetical protein
MLSSRQESVALAIASGRTVAAAARESRVACSTLWQWLQQPEFRARVAELRRQVTDRAIGRMADAMAGAALDALLKLLTAKSAAIRLDAARSIFDLYVGTVNATELRARVEELERQGRR